MIDEKTVITLHDTKWVSLRKIVDPANSITESVYSHETRCDGQIIAILPYKNNNGIEYMLRSEITPPWQLEHSISTITGGLEKGLTPLETALMELEEEAGYKAKKEEMIFLGTCRGIKSCDTVYHLFSIDVTNKVQGDRLGDGSYHDVNSDVVWKKYDEFDECVDPIGYTMLYKLINKLNISEKLIR